MPLALAALLAASGAATFETTFDQANAAYFRGEFDRAAEGYQRLVDLGVRDPDVFYNLGDAHLRAGRLGPAIWAFERALTLAPGDEDVQFNLDAARSQADARVRDKIAGASRPPLWVRVVTSASATGWTWLFLPLYVAVFAGLIAARRMAGASRAAVQAATALCLAACLCAGALLGGRIWHDERTPRAIVLPDELAVREGPDAGSRSTFRVHAGLPVVLTQRDGAWARVRLANGLEGWVEERQLGRL